MSKKISWAEEHDDRLRELLAIGYNPEEIAGMMAREYDEFATVTRNAVMGRLFRLGMSIPRAPVSKQARKRKHAKPKPKPEVAASAWQPGPVQVVDLLMHHCRWPVTPNKPWGFCGAERTMNSPYCMQHSIISRGRQ